MSSKAFQGQSAIVTGGANGIGRAMCEALAAEGFNIAILDLAKSGGEVAIAGLQAQYPSGKFLFLACDVTDSQRLVNCFLRVSSQFGSIDVVVNNAGIARPALDFDQDPDISKWQLTLDVNLTAVVNGTRLAASHMINQQKSSVDKRKFHIVNVASMGGLLPQPYDPVYCAAKHGVIGLTRSLFWLRKAHGIQCNCICPSFVDTGLVQNGLNSPVGAGKDFKQDWFRKAVKSQPKLIQPAQVGEALVQLLESNRSGQVMRITAANGIDFQSYGHASAKERALAKL